MKSRSVAGRKMTNSFVMVLAGSAAAFGLFMLLWILYAVMQRGASAINWAFFTTAPDSPGGGVVHAIVGTLMITAIATLIGVPIGTLGGIYLAEFGQDSRYARVVRFFSNILMGAPSIVIGVFVYTIIVVPTHGFSGYAGAVALAIIMLPVVLRTTEDMLKLVPNSLRECALALGAPRHRMIFQVVFKAARSGVITGVILAIARVSGETAPLLFTAFNYNYWSLAMDKPMGNLTVTIFNYARDPSVALQTKAWGASLLIMAGVLIMNLTARMLTRERKARA